MEKELMRIANDHAVGDAVLKTLSDKLEIKSFEDLNKLSPAMIHHMFPELDKGELYNLGSSVRNAVAEKNSPVQAEAADPFNNDSIRSRFLPVDDKYDWQGTNGSCTAFAATNLLEFYWATKGKRVRLSRAFTYIFCNEWEGKNIPLWSPIHMIIGNNYAVWPETTGRMMTQYGCCTDADLPYDYNFPYYDANQNPVVLKKHPKYVYNPQTLVPRAKNYAATGMQVEVTQPLQPWNWVTTNIDNHLRRGFPSIYAFMVPANLGDYGTGVIPREDGNKGWDAHSVLIIGKLENYTPPGQQTGNWYIFKNSWGKEFGKNNPLAPYKALGGCGLINEHDVYWRNCQALHASW